MTILNPIRVGYLRLTDSAPLIVAQALGFYAEYGLNVELVQDVSWANVRDKLAAGVLDAAQMLAPLPAMTTMGVSGLRSHLITGLVMSRNGNAITISNELFEDINHNACERPLNQTAARLIGQRVQDLDHKLTFAVVHTFSGHMLLLRRWLASGGLDPDSDVRIIIMPPSQMADSLSTGVIDGFCVGEPWSTVAVEANQGAIVAAGSEIWPAAAEKVLCVQQHWHESNPEHHLQLRMALMQACRWIDQPENHDHLIQVLSDVLGLSATTLARSLSGKIMLDHKNTIEVQNFHMFHGNRLGAPDIEEQCELISLCAAIMGKTIDREKTLYLAKQTALPQLYAQAEAALGWQ